MIDKLRNFLAWLPSTNALVVTTIFMSLATTLRALGPKWVCGPIPEGWYTFVISFATIALVQFTAKRATQHKEPSA